MSLTSNVAVGPPVAPTILTEGVPGSTARHYRWERGATPCIVGPHGVTCYVAAFDCTDSPGDHAHKLTTDQWVDVSYGGVVAVRDLYVYIAAGDYDTDISVCGWEGSKHGARTGPVVFPTITQAGVENTSARIFTFSRPAFPVLVSNMDTASYPILVSVNGGGDVTDGNAMYKIGRGEWCDVSLGGLIGVTTVEIFLDDDPPCDYDKTVVGGWTS